MIIDTYQTEIQKAIIRFLVANPDPEPSGREIYRAIDVPCSEWVIYAELRKLRLAGFIASRRNGKSRAYRLVDPPEAVEE